MNANCQSNSTPERQVPFNRTFLLKLTALVKAQKTCIEFILKGRATILMNKYRNVQVYFADAALVVLAEVGGSMKFSR